MAKPKLIVCTTIPLSLIFYKGQLTYLKKAFDVEACSSPSTHLEQVQREEKIETYAISMEREIHLIKDVLSLIKLIKLFRVQKPDIVHASTPKAGLLCTVAAWLVGVPRRIYYLHGLRYDGLDGLKKQIVMLLENLTCRLSTHVFAVSNGVKERLRSDRITEKQVHLIGNGSCNGIDLRDYDSTKTLVGSSESLNLPEDSFVFGYVGRIVGDKGINELVTAFTSTAKVSEKCYLVLVGPLDEKGSGLLEDTIVEIKSNKRILHVGFQRDIRPYLKQIHTFVFPSYREGFGMSVLEALAMDIPVIASNITGCNEIIINGQNGVLIEPKSIEELKSAMANLENNKDYRNHLASNARNSCWRYEQSIIWSKTLEAYENIL